MENINDQPKVLSRLVGAGVFSDQPFTLFDVGCSGGIHEAWRAFGPRTAAYGFDPQATECQRLQAAEPSPSIEYVSTYVGLPDDHPIKRDRLAANNAGIAGQINPWSRLSTAEAISRTDLQSQSQPIHEDLVPADQIVSIADFVAAQELAYVDFIKVDTDGSDLDVVISAEPILESHRVLGLYIEVNFIGGHEEYENTFLNIDRVLRRHGYSLFDLSLRRYSRAALPLPFEYNILAQTHGGQPIQGDALYLRDFGAPDYEETWPDIISADNIQKLLGLFDLFSLPDCAAEILTNRREMLAPIIDVDELLDLLTPPLDGRQTDYQSYVSAFRENPARFFPGTASKAGGN